MTTGEKLAEVEEIEEATPIELFYDLFFVANLTTVTSVHYITEWRSNCPFLIYAYNCSGSMPERSLTSFNSLVILHPVFYHPLVYLATCHSLGCALLRRLCLRESLQVYSFRGHGCLFVRLNDMGPLQPQFHYRQVPQDNDAHPYVFEIHYRDPVLCCDGFRLVDIQEERRRSARDPRRRYVDFFSCVPGGKKKKRKENLELLHRAW